MGCLHNRYTGMWRRFDLGWIGTLRTQMTQIRDDRKKERNALAFLQPGVLHNCRCCIATFVPLLPTITMSAPAVLRAVIYDPVMS